jgi:hypothetical protein
MHAAEDAVDVDAAVVEEDIPGAERTILVER